METVKKMLQRDTCLPLLGPCMIIFAVPLLLPGLTLTLVALWDETGFSRFSALHVLGIVLLVTSGLLLVVGVVLHCTVTKKAKGRVCPEDDDEEGGEVDDSIPRSSPCYPGPPVVGNVHSTHDVRSSTHTPATRLGTDRGTGGSDHHPDTGLHPSSGAKDGRVDTPLPSPSVCPSSAGHFPRKGQLPPLSSTAAAAAVMTLQGGSRGQRHCEDSSLSAARGMGEDSSLSAARGMGEGDRSLSAERSVGMGVGVGTHQSAEKNEGLGEGLSAQLRSSCNYMLSDSEDERAEALRYATVAAQLMTDRDGKIRTASTLSSSSSSLSSTTQSSRKMPDCKHEPRSAERRELPETGQTGVSRQRTVQVDREGVPHTTRDLSAASSSSVEDQQSEDVQATRTAVHSSDNEDRNNNVGAEPFFVTRQPSTEWRPHHHTVQEEEDSGSENSPEAESPAIHHHHHHHHHHTHQAPTLQDPSSSSIYTESPSHGTYSVRSFVSEDLALKASSEDLVMKAPSEDLVMKAPSEDLVMKAPSEDLLVTEDYVFHPSSGLLLADPSPETPHSPSPVPLRADPRGGWKDQHPAHHSTTVLRGGRSDSSSHGSPVQPRPSASSLPSDPDNGNDDNGNDDNGNDDNGNPDNGNPDKDGGGHEPSPTDHHHHSDRKKKRKKKKKRREREGGGRQGEAEEHAGEEWGERWGEKGEVAAGSPRWSLLRSGTDAPHQQQHSEHHVHWPDDQGVAPYGRPSP